MKLDEIFWGHDIDKMKSDAGNGEVRLGPEILVLARYRRNLGPGK